MPNLVTPKTKYLYALKESCFWRSGCGSGGKVVTSYNKGPRLESSLLQNLNWTVDFFEM